MEIGIGIVSFTAIVLVLGLLVLLARKLLVPSGECAITVNGRMTFNAAVGRKLLEVGMLMHRDEGLPVVRESASMEEAVQEMSRKKLGMTCIVDDGGRLAGVLTDGDLRRRMLAEPSPLEGSVADAMTRTPVTIGPGALATEALKIMEERKITSLPVVDGDELAGLIQIHDLWRTELF